MAINLPDIGQVDWGGELNSALTQLDNQTIVDGRLEGDDLVLIANSGAESNVGSVRGRPGEDGQEGPQGPQGPPGESHARLIDVDDYAQPGDASDTQRWQRAINYAISLPKDGTSYTITGTKDIYYFNAAVNFKGLHNAVIGGAASSPLTFKPSSGRSGGGMFAVPTGSFSGSTENVTFSNFRVDGGIVSPPDGVFDREQDRQPNPAGYLSSFLNIRGDLFPGEGNNGVVDRIRLENVTIDNCMGLPLLIQGARNVEMTGCRVHRCKDIGFTFCEGVRFTDNRVTWSADNGVSLSRGCTQVVCVGNTVEGSYYAGIHLGGFGGDAGPEHVVIASNTVYNSRMYGISAVNGARYLTITGNVVDGVLRGGASSSDRDHLVDSAGNANGSGIAVSGYITPVSSSSPTVTYWAQDIVISGNVVRHADRNGISVLGGTERVTITGNTVTDIGSEFSVGGGVVISHQHSYYNIAIGAYGLHDSVIRDLAITGNTVVDTRQDPIINYAVRIPSTRANQRSNYGYNLRNPQTF